MAFGNINLQQLLNQALKGNDTSRQEQLIKQAFNTQRGLVGRDVEAAARAAAARRGLDPKSGAGAKILSELSQDRLDALAAAEAGQLSQLQSGVNPSALMSLVSTIAGIQAQQERDKLAREQWEFEKQRIQEAEREQRAQNARSSAMIRNVSGTPGQLPYTPSITPSGGSRATYAPGPGGGGGGGYSPQQRPLGVAIGTPLNSPAISSPAHSIFRQDTINAQNQQAKARAANIASMLGMQPTGASSAGAGGLTGTGVSSAGVTPLQNYDYINPDLQMVSSESTYTPPGGSPMLSTQMAFQPNVFNQQQFAGTSYSPSGYYT